MPIIKGNSQISRLKLGTMTTVDRLAITIMVAGSVVYDTDMGGEYIWDGSAWFRFLNQPFDYINGDPTTLNPGDIWYNSVANVFKGVSLVTSGVGAWVSATSSLTSRFRLASVGTISSLLAFGGTVTVHTAITESWNGVVWVIENPMLLARDSLGGAGTSLNDALSFGGSTATLFYANTELYNGTSWLAKSPMLITRQLFGDAGISTVALGFGGFNGITLGSTESWNGTIWSSGGNLITGRHRLSGVGFNTAALSLGGNNGTTLNNVESYNGTTWSTISGLLLARRDLGCSGTQTATLAFGGVSGVEVGNTESFNGTSWTAEAFLVPATQSMGAAGTSTEAASIDGLTPVVVNTVQVFKPILIPTTVTFTVV